MKVNKSITYNYEMMLGKLAEAEDAWLLCKPKCTCEGRDYLVQDDGNLSELRKWIRHCGTKTHRVYEEKMSKFLEKQPYLHHIAGIHEGDLFVDICYGIAPTKLVFHQQFKNRFPHNPIQELLSSLKRRQKHLGISKVDINLYNSSDLGGLINLEVNLCQDVPEVEDLEVEAETLRTGRYLLKTSQ